MDKILKIQKTTIPGLMVVDGDVYTDHRGVFTRLFCQDELHDLLGDRNVVQVNYSRTTTVGAVRGLHFQYPPHAEMKCIRCLTGRVWDVAVDLRISSPTFLKWHGEELSKENMRMMIIPEGFAHGFQVLENDSELLYFHTAFYAPEAEGGIQPADEMIGIEWPMPIQDLSKKDSSHPLLTSDFSGLNI